MLRHFFALAPLTVLVACAYAIDGSVQDVKFSTPGAYGAECSVYVEKVRYIVHPPQTINIFKSKGELEVDCMAPGNRRRKVFIEPSVEDSSAFNLAHGGAGYAWDYASGALWRYPDVVEVDFTDAPTTGEELPAHNRPDIRAPEDHMLEEFSPGQPRMNADRYVQPVEILRRQKPAAAGYTPYEDAAAFSESSSGRDKGDLMDAVPAKSEPMPLFPGE